MSLQSGLRKDDRTVILKVAKRIDESQQIKRDSSFFRMTKTNQLKF
jgi:hypothetical protein